MAEGVFAQRRNFQTQAMDLCSLQDDPKKQKL